MNKATTILVALCVAALAAALLPSGKEHPPKGVAQTSASYEYEVLPSIQPGYTAGTTSTFAPENLVLSCGWHAACGGSVAAVADRDGLDVRHDAGTNVYAVLRAVTYRAGLTAEVKDVSDPNTTRCRYVEVEFLDGLKAVGSVRYVHVVPSVVGTNVINVPGSDSGLAALGMV